MNKVILVGELLGEPELGSLEFEEGFISEKYALLRVMPEEDTAFPEIIRVTVFKRSLIKLVKKSLSRESRILIEGRLTNKQYVDEYMEERSIYEVYLDGPEDKLELLEASQVNKAAA